MRAGGRIPGLVFGEVAEDFDRVRLPYPITLVDDVLDYLGPGEPGRRALEIGAGTGKATVAFAGRGLQVLALEPDDAMAGILARNVTSVEILRSTFEDYVLDEPFDVVYCADAWHWTRAETRWQLAAKALHSGGALALFWNNGRIDRPDQRQSMMDVFAALAPTVVLHDEPAHEERMYAEPPGSDLIERGEFAEHVGRVYRSLLVYSAADYVTLTSTRSQIRMLPETLRARVLSGLAEVLDAPVQLAVEAVLYLARRR